MDIANNMDGSQANSSEAAGPNESTTNAANGGRLQANSNEVTGPNESTTNPAAGDSPEGGLLFGRQTSDNFGDHKKLCQDLGPLRIFCITISGTIGLGLFVSSGEALRIAGPGGSITAFVIVGLLAVLVMAGLSEMLVLWPIPNAMVEFVDVFVDKELGIVVGLTYWYCYAATFSTLTLSVVRLADYWDYSESIRTMLYFVPPVGIMIINLFGVRLYAMTEVVGAIFKLSVVLLSIILMGYANRTGGGSAAENIGTKYSGMGFEKDDMIRHIGTACCIAIPIASFAFVGVEIVAVTAFEAKSQDVPPSRNQQPSPTQIQPLPRSPSQIQSLPPSPSQIQPIPPDPSQIQPTSLQVQSTDPVSNLQSRGKSLYQPAKYVALITSVIYVILVIMLVLNVEWNDPNLPQAFKGSSTKSENNYKRLGYKDTKSDSILIIALVESGMENWAGPMTGCLIAVVISTANTALYVASRTLYGLTMSDSFEKQHPILAKLSKTTPPAEKNGNRASWWTPWRYVGGNVPLWAVPVSAAALCFVPLRQLISGDSIQTFQHITSQTASVGCLLVWASQCLAFMRYYFWLKGNKRRLVGVYARYNTRWGNQSNREFSNILSRWQPVPAFIGFIGSLTIVLVLNSASWWETPWTVKRVLAAYTGPGVTFFALIFLKFRRLLRNPTAPLFRWELPNLEDAILQLNMVRRDSASSVRGGSRVETYGGNAAVGTDGVGAIPLQEVRVEGSQLPGNGHESPQPNGTV